MERIIVQVLLDKSQPSCPLYPFFVCNQLVVNFKIPDEEFSQAAYMTEC